MVPVITVVTSVLVLKEPVTWVSVMGTVMAVAGLFLSEYNGKGSGNSECACGKDRGAGEEIV